MGFSASLVGSYLLLVAVLGAGIVAIIAARRLLRPEPLHGSLGRLGPVGGGGLGGLEGRAGRAGRAFRASRGSPAFQGVPASQAAVAADAAEMSDAADAARASRAAQGDWETTLAAYKNLRDEGVLSEEEFRKIRTLVEPRSRSGMPELRPRHWPPTDPAGPEQTRE